jgi:anti-sigma factor RsiW
VAAALPQLADPSARAFALVALVGRSRPDVASDLDLDPERLADLLAQARKTLRRSTSQLPGSGWCERAERLISDRLDGAMEGSGAGRLEVHLRNCPRCVEHERRLVQATDSLAQRFEEATGVPEPGPKGERAAPALAVVRPSSGARALPFGQPVRPPPGPPAPQPAAPEPEPGISPEPAPTAAPEPAVRPARPRRFPAPALSVDWRLLLVLAVLFAVATVVLVVAGALGASLH